MITLKTLPQATAQEVFDQVAKHLLTQNKRSQSTDGDLEPVCCYRGDEDTRCAAGCLIGPEEYHPDMEGKSWEGLRRRGDVGAEHFDLIDALQRIHDRWRPLDWPTQLRELAEMHGLNTNVLP